MNDHRKIIIQRYILSDDYYDMIYTLPPPPVTNVNMLAALEKDYEEVGVDSVEAEGEEEGDEY